MKVAVVQMGATADKARNLEKAKKFVWRAAERGARLIVLPELFNYRGRLKAQEDFSAVCEKIPGESVKPFLEIARQRRVFILLGSICEKVPQARKAYNASILIDGQGRVRAIYRKKNLFDAVIGKKVLRESEIFRPGRKGTLVDVGEFKAGMSVCYDLRFPGVYRDYAKKGATILFVPSAFTHQTGRAHWKALLRARAIENLSYVLAPNQVGEDWRRVRSYGHSMIVGPWGDVLAEASENSEEIIFAEIKKSELRKARRALPMVF